jgi:hypothetical protein
MISTFLLEIQVFSLKCVFQPTVTDVYSSLNGSRSIGGFNFLFSLPGNNPGLLRLFSIQKNVPLPLSKICR